MSEKRTPLPPFTFETAIEKVRKAEDAWNTRDPLRVALAARFNVRFRGPFGLEARPAYVAE